MNRAAGASSCTSRTLGGQRMQNVRKDSICVRCRAAIHDDFGRKDPAQADDTTEDSLPALVCQLTLICAVARW